MLSRNVDFDRRPVESFQVDRNLNRIDPIEEPPKLFNFGGDDFLIVGFEVAVSRRYVYLHRRLLIVDIV
jgi:hypothetical protein